MSVAVTALTMAVVSVLKMAVEMGVQLVDQWVRTMVA